MDFCIKCGMD